MATIVVTVTVTVTVTAIVFVRELIARSEGGAAS